MANDDDSKKRLLEHFLRSKNPERPEKPKTPKKMNQEVLRLTPFGTSFKTELTPEGLKHEKDMRIYAARIQESLKKHPLAPIVPPRAFMKTEGFKRALKSDKNKDKDNSQNKGKDRDNDFEL